MRKEERDMAGIRKRGDSFSITISMGRDRKGKQIRKTVTFHPDPDLTPAKQMKEAERYASTLEDQIRREKSFGDRTRFESLAEKYLEYTKDGNGIEVTTHAGYEQTLKLRLIPFFGKMKIRDIDNSSLMEYETEMRKDGARNDGKTGGLSSGTIIKDMRVLSSVLQFGIDIGILENNVVIQSRNTRHIKKNYEKGEYKTSMNVFSEQQLKTYFYFIEHPFHIRHKERRYVRNGKEVVTKPYATLYTTEPMHAALLTIFPATGARRGEIVDLKWEDADFEGKTLMLDSEIAYAGGKQFQKSTKNNRSRLIALPDIAVSALKRWKEVQTKDSGTSGWKGRKGLDFEKNYIFTNKDGSDHIHVDTPYRMFTTFCRLVNDSEELAKAEAAANGQEYQCTCDPNEVQIPDFGLVRLSKLRLHDLRHTNATIQSEHNVPIPMISQSLGHASTEVTSRVYIHLNKGVDRSGADAIDEVFGKE